MSGPAEASRLVARFRALANVTVALHSASTLDEVTDLLTEQAASLFDADFAIFGLLQPRSRKLLQARMFCRQPGNSNLVSGSITLPVDRPGPVREALESGKLAASERADRMATMPLSSAQEALIACPTAAAPLLIRGNVRGVLSVSWNQDERPLTEEDERLLLALANAGAIATERSITQREQARRLEELEALNRLKSEFLSVVSHEFRTPLTSIKTSVSLLATTIPRQDEVAGRLLKNVTRNVERLELLISDLLTTTRLKSGSLQLDLQPSSLRTLIDETLPTIAPLAETKQQRLVVDCPQRLPQASVDRRWFGQMLLNLLSNAHKYSPSGGTITIKVREGQGGLTTSVCDSGNGIPEEKLPHLFEEFYRVEQGPEGGATGVGLGLAIVKSLVGLHGGRIWVENLAAGGTAFHFSIPTAGHAREVEAARTKA